jgi:hypothetical protein
MKKLLISCLLLSALALGAQRLPAAPSSESQPTNAELLKQVQALAARVDQLEDKLARYEKTSPTPSAERHKTTNSTANVASQDINASSSTSAPSTFEDNASVKTPLFGLGYRSNSVLSIGAYGELKFGNQEAPGGWKDGFDAGRIVLLPTLQVTENIIFNAEIEFEHGGIAEDEDDKLTGSVDIEQAYIDFKFNEYFNWRAPGVDVVPFGFINLFHEPTQFYSVQRPELDNGLIPTTWFEGSTSIYGKVVDN